MYSRLYKSHRHLLPVAAACIVSLAFSGCDKKIPPSAVSVNPAEAELNVGEEVTLEASVLPVDAYNKAVTWSSADAGVASVTAGDGSTASVTGVAEGQTTITVTTMDGGLTSVCAVTVSDPSNKVNKVSLDIKDSTLTIGDVITISATVLPENAKDRSLTWKSSDEKTASVKVAQGGFSAEVTAKAAGSASVTATSVNGFWAGCQITVKDVYVPVESLTVKPEGLTVCIDQTSNISAEVKPDGATDRSVTWSVDDPLVASVDAEGNVTGISEGTCAVTATTVGTAAGGTALSASCEVTVSGYASVSRISLDKTSLTMNIGKSDTINVTIAPSYAHNKKVTCTAGDQSLVSLTQIDDKRIEVKALKAGNGVITVTSADGGDKSAKCLFEVLKDTVRVAGVWMAVHDTVFRFTEIKDSLTLAAEVLPEDATDRRLVWVSGNPSVAFVRDNGTVIAMGEGSTFIAAFSHENYKYSDTCRIVLRRDTIYIDKISVNAKPSSGTGSRLYSGQTVALEASYTPSDANFGKNLTWKSAGEEVSVKSSGDKSAVATVVNSSNVTSENEVTVASGNGVEAVTSVYFGRVAVFAGDKEAGDTIEIEAGGGCEVSCRWNVSGSAYKKVPAEDATVYSLGSETAYYYDGVLHAKAAGVTAVRAKVGSMTIDIPVKVVDKSDKVKGVAVKPVSAYLTVGDALQLEAVITPDYAADKSVTWVSSNPAAASVDASGKVVGLAEGAATVTATTRDGGYTASCSVTVKKEITRVTGLYLLYDTVRVYEGETVTITTNVYPADATDKSVVWSSSDAGKADISEEGKDSYGEPYVIVAGVAEGEADITAVTVDGNFKESCHVIVKEKPNPVTAVSMTMSPVTSGSDRTYSGKVIKLKAFYEPADANIGTNFTWRCSDGSVASLVADENDDLSATAVVKNEANGLKVALITVTSDIGFFATGSVYAGELSVGKDGKAIRSLDVRNLTETQLQCVWEKATGVWSEVPASEVAWSSSNDSYATVSSQGLLTSVTKNKDVTITASVGSAEIRLPVEIGADFVHVSEVALNQKSVEAVKDSVFTLLASVTPYTADNKNLIWTSSDESVAKVDLGGKVTVQQKIGTAVIRAESEDGGIYDECTVSVPDKVLKLTLSHGATTDDRLYSGQTVTITPDFYPSYATSGKRLTWRSSSGTYGSVNNGTVTIANKSNISSFLSVNAVNENGLGASTDVFFGKLHLLCDGAEVPQTITASPMKTGDTAQLSVTYETDGGGTQAAVSSVVWNSETPGIISVDSSGKITAKGKSTAAKVTATVGSVTLTFYANIKDK